MEARAPWMVAVACIVALAGGCIPAPDVVGRTASAPGPAAGQAWTVPGLRLRLIYVAPGSFQMGSNDGAPDERPVHRVQLSRGFWMGQCEVTQAEYEAVTSSGADGASGGAVNPSAFASAQNPVETVSWDEAMAFCERLTGRERAAGRLPRGHEYRLPTEAEWEYAARGGSQSRGFVYSGSSTAARVAWYDANSDNAPHPVARKAANELGLYDMSGNVWEWCLDGYDPGFYAQSGGTDPVKVSEGSGRVFRGGCWGFSSGFARSSCRSALRAADSCDGLGFRIVLAGAASAP